MRTSCLIVPFFVLCVMHTTSYGMFLVEAVKSWNPYASDEDRGTGGNLLRGYGKFMQDENIEKAILGITNRDEEEKTRKIYDEIERVIAGENNIEDISASQYVYRTGLATRHGIRYYNILARFMKSSDQSKDAVKQSGAILATALADAEKLLELNKNVIPNELAEGLSGLIRKAHDRSARVVATTSQQRLSSSLSPSSIPAHVSALPTHPTNGSLIRASSSPVRNSVGSPKMSRNESFSDLAQRHQHNASSSSSSPSTSSTGSESDGEWEASFNEAPGQLKKENSETPPLPSSKEHISKEKTLDEGMNNPFASSPEHKQNPEAVITRKKKGKN